MDDLKIVRGNTFETIVEVKAYRYSGEEITDFDLKACTDVKIIPHIGNNSFRLPDYKILDGNQLFIRWDNPLMPVGKYSLEILGKLHNTCWRYYDKSTIFTIVNSNDEQNIPTSSCDDNSCCRVCAKNIRIILGEKGEKGDKGDKGDTGTVDVNNYYTKQEVDLKILQFITDGTINLDNYTTFNDVYIKSDVYTKQQINDLLSNISTIKGDKGDKGDKGEPGADGVTPTIYINRNGYWVINDVVTDVKARGEDGGTVDAILSDWNATDTESAAYIKNKPIIPSAQILSDWTLTDNTKADYIKNKPQIPDYDDYLELKRRVAELERLVNQSDDPVEPVTTYYWYAGQTDPATMSSISPVLSGANEFTSGGGWHSFGSTLPLLVNQLIKGGVAGSQWYVAIPASGNYIATASDMSTIDSSVTIGSTVTISDTVYLIFIYSATTSARATIMLVKN